MSATFAHCCLVERNVVPFGSSVRAFRKNFLFPFALWEWHEGPPKCRYQPTKIQTVTNHKPQTINLLPKILITCN